MTLEQLIDIAAEAYDDGGERLIKRYFDDPNGKLGDCLARHIMSEIVRTYDASADDGDQLEEVVRVLRSAQDSLDGVVSRFELEASKFADTQSEKDEDEGKLFDLKKGEFIKE